MYSFSQTFSAFLHPILPIKSLIRWGAFSNYFNIYNVISQNFKDVLSFCKCLETGLKLGLFPLAIACTCSLGTFVPTKVLHKTNPSLFCSHILVDVGGTSREEKQELSFTFSLKKQLLCPPLNRITLGQHKSDNNNKLI